jgi:hypothetical protein
MTRRLIAIAALVGVVVACSPSAPSPTPTQAAIESPSPAELAAVNFRTTFGLQADLAFVRAVAADPRASSREYSVPLLPAELADLQARFDTAVDVRAAIEAYGDLDPSEFGGLYVDQQNGGAVTVLWTGHLEEHAAGVWRRLGPGAHVESRLVTYPLRDLRDLQDRIGRDWDWMRAFAIAPIGVGVDVAANRVHLEISSADPKAAARIVAHYAVPASMIGVESDGTGALLFPLGDIRGRVVDSIGKQPGEAVAGELSLAWTSDGLGRCGSGDVGYGVAGDGSFGLPCSAGGHTVDVQYLVGDTWTTVASGHVVVIAGETAELVIRLSQPWSSVVTP